MRLPLLRLERHLQPRDGDPEAARDDAAVRSQVLARQRGRAGGQRQPIVDLTISSSGETRSPRLRPAGGFCFLDDVLRPTVMPGLAPSHGGAMPLALLLDAVCGEPPAMAHPVVWIGSTIARLGGAAPSC